MKTRTDFLRELQHQAKHQANLNSTRLLPKQLDPVTAIIGNYPWQTVLITSGITAAVLEILHVL